MQVAKNIICAIPAVEHNTSNIFTGKINPVLVKSSYWLLGEIYRVAFSCINFWNDSNI